MEKDPNARLKELHVRRMLCQHALRILEDEKDPRAPEAIRHYRGQLAEIDRRIALVAGAPPPVIIGLKQARLTARKGG